MSNRDIARRFMYDLEKNIRLEMANMAEPALVKACRFVISTAVDYARFHSVTGNTINAYAVGAYLDGSLKGFATSYDALNSAPVRMTLKKGEMYTLPYYWGGDPVTGKPYVGETGDRSYWGYDEAYKFLQTHRPTRRGWCYLIVVGTDYARYIEARRGADVLTRLHDGFAAISGNVSEIKTGG